MRTVSAGGGDVLVKAIVLAAALLLASTTATAQATQPPIDQDCSWTVSALVCIAGTAYCTVFTQCYVEVLGCYVGYNPEYNEPFYSGCRDA